MTTVAVLMSTYNGEKYIEEQINSIFFQKDVSVTLYIRDDGSTDSTVSIISRLSKNFNINVTIGENIGWRRSFMELVYLVPSTYEYYAFSDQDDVWLKEKLISSVKNLKEDDVPALCCSAQTLVDQDLKPLRKELHMFPRTFEEAMTNISCRGCTEVFNKQLLLQLKAYKPSITFAHDRWVARVANCLGIIHFDPASYILYRQHENNSAGNNYNVSLKDQIDRALKNYKNKDFYYWYAKEILNGYGDNIEDRKKAWLSTLVRAKTNLRLKLKLLQSRNFVSESIKGTVLLKLVMFFGLYQK